MKSTTRSKRWCEGQKIENVRKGVREEVGCRYGPASKKKQPTAYSHIAQYTIKPDALTIPPISTNDNCTIQSAHVSIVVDNPSLRRWELKASYFFEN